MQYIILLRGVNIGGRKIKMAELRTCLEQAGYAGVQTVLQTGNIILESKKTPDKLHDELVKLLEDNFHYPAKISVTTAEKIHSVVENYPFANCGFEFHRYAVFTDQENADALEEAYHGKLGAEVEAIQAGEDVLYWRVLKGHTLDSDFGKGKYSPKDTSKYFMTNRNLNTLEKILKKCE